MIAVMAHVGRDGGVSHAQRMRIRGITRWDVTDRGLLRVLWIAGANLSVVADGTVVEVAGAEGGQGFIRDRPFCVAASHDVSEAEQDGDGRY
jgi:hypothetical protein